DPLPFRLSIQFLSLPYQQCHSTLHLFLKSVCTYPVPHSEAQRNVRSWFWYGNDIPRVLLSTTRDIFHQVLRVAVHNRREAVQLCQRGFPSHTLLVNTQHLLPDHAD